MNRSHLLLALLLGLTVATYAVEPATTPEVKQTDAPEVTDPDLKEALPAMRQGTEEPLGGFKAAGLRGRSALNLGIAATGAGTLQSIGLNYWMTDRLAVVSRLGFDYAEPSPSSFDAKVAAALGVRGVAFHFGPTGFLFWQATGGLYQSRRYDVQKSTNPFYSQFQERELLTNSYHAALGLGSEVFWPGSDRFAIEILGNIKALWTFTENSENDYSDVAGFGGTYRVQTTGRRFGVAWENSDVLAGFNIYF